MTPPTHVCRREVAEPVCHTVMRAPGSPEGREDRSGCQRRWPGGGRREEDDTSDVFTESRLHADICQPIGAIDEEPQSADGRDCCGHQRQRGDGSRRDTLQQERGPRGSQRQRHQENDGDSRERVHRIMQHLRE